MDTAVAARFATSIDRIIEVSRSTATALEEFAEAYRSHAPKKTLTMTSKLGTFTFESNVILSKAKLIRDAVTGQFFNPLGGFRIKDEHDAQMFAAEHLGRDLENIGFDLFINPIK